MITICDTGPLLAYLNRNDPHHDWAVAQMKQVRAPRLVCDAVLTEVVYFLREDGLTVDPLFQLLECGAIRVALDLSTYWPRIRNLMTRYRQMDLADAQVVAMTELQARSRVLTIDHRDFSVYRRNDRQADRFRFTRKAESAVTLGFDSVPGRHENQYRRLALTRRLGCRPWADRR